MINQLRAILLERGVVVPQGRRKLEQELVVLIDEKQGAGLGGRVVKLVGDMRTQWKEIDRRIGEFDAEFAAYAKADEVAALLLSIPGIGPLIASALTAAIGRGESFAKARDLAAWLGLVPRQSTTGGKPKLLGISKRGNKFLRKLLIDGARRLSRILRKRIRHWDAGRRACWREYTRMSRSSLSPINWPGSPGRCCGGGRSSLLLLIGA